MATVKRFGIFPITLLLSLFACSEDQDTCPELRDAVHELCGDSIESIENTLDCYNAKTMDCEGVTKSIEAYTRCDEKTIVEIIHLNSDCNEIECPSVQLDCPESRFYHDGSYDLEEAFGGCIFSTSAEWNYAENPDEPGTPVWQVSPSICHKGKCVDAATMVETVCQ